MGAVTTTPEYDEDGNVIRKSYSTDFGAGPWMWDLDPGDDVDMISFDSPGSNTQEFWRFCTAVAMASLDLPYSMWDSSEGNFFGNKTAWLAYSRSCDVKRARCCATRDKITAHKYLVAIRDGRLMLPRVAKKRLTVEDRPWQWVPRLMPWWRPLEEVTAALSAIGGGLSNPYHVCMEGDQGDFEENIRMIEKALKYAAAHGVPLSYVVGEQAAAAAEKSADRRREAEKANKPT
jgi:capsid protein